MKQYLTDDWENSVECLTKSGWATVKDIVATAKEPNEAVKFATKTLEVNLLRMIDKSRKGRVMVIPWGKPDFHYEWVKTESGRFVRISEARAEVDDLLSQFKNLADSLAKGVNDNVHR